MKVYNKLVRDRIPEIIEKSGKKSNTEILSNEDYLSKLNEKLMEEIKEYADSNEDLNELADIVEVIYGIVEAKGVSLEEFETIRKQKADERGGFKEKIFLISVE